MARGKVIFGNGRKIPDRYFVNGVEVSKAEYDKAFPAQFSGKVETVNKTSKCWPRLSDSMGVHPNQRRAAYEASVKQGVPTEFHEDGRAIIRDNAHQRDLQKVLGVINKDAGYGEVTG